MNVEAHVQDIDVAAGAQRDLQRLIQDRTIFVGSIDAGENMLDTCIA